VEKSNALDSTEYLCGLSTLLSEIKTPGEIAAVRVLRCIQNSG
jgi:hypothetical protein